MDQPTFGASSAYARSSAFASRDSIAFQALSVGIGLGELRPPGKTPVTRVAPSLVHKVEAFEPEPLLALDAMAKARAPERQLNPKGPRRGWSVKLMAYGLDFFFVALTLVVALGLATVLSAVRTGETENWMATKPIQWLAGLNPYLIIGGVYGVFFAYTLVFKLLAGKTCGETLLGVESKIGRKTVKA